MTLTRGLHDAAQTARAREAFAAFRGGLAALERLGQIDDLPRKPWGGRLVYQVRCRGVSGRGPHDLWVPEAVLWAVLDLERFRCPYHAGDPIPEVQP